MELNYIKCGDYYIPDIGLQKPNIRLGHYGMLRKAYLREHRPALYAQLVLSETLYEHCAEIEPQEAALTLSCRRLPRAQERRRN